MFGSSVRALRRIGRMAGLLFTVGCAVDARQLVPTDGVGGVPGSGGNPSSGGTGTSTGGSATGGSTSTGTGGTQPIVCSPITAHSGFPLIDDFEDGNGQIAGVDSRIGFWFVYNDGTTGGTQTPPLNNVLPSMPGANGSRYAMRTTGTGFTNWGAGLGAELDASGNRTCTLNLAAYHGVQFWTKGTPATAQIRFQLTQSNLQQIQFGGTCNPATLTCSDFYDVSFNPTPDWSQHTVLFSDMKQEGWGSKAPFDVTQIQGIRFQITAPSFEFWVDDISLVP